MSNEQTLLQKIGEIQSKLIAPKKQFNAFGKYQYRSCEDILEALKPLLKEKGVVLILSDEIVLIGDRHYIKASAEVTDDSGNFKASVAYAREPKERKGMDEAQVTGATSSYARKYALNGLFCIDDQKDADSNNNHSEKQSAQPIPQPPQAQEPPPGKHFISEKQGKRLIAIAKGNGYSVDLIKDYIKVNYNLEKLSHITSDVYEEIVDHFQIQEGGDFNG